MIGIHQSQFLPWLPFFYKMFSSDIFIILDDVQFQKNGVQNRNLIKTPQGQLWLTVPVRRSLETPLNAAEINDQDILLKLLKTIEVNYRKSPFFLQVFPRIEAVFKKPYAYLHQLNMDLLEVVLSLLGKKVNICLSSSMFTSQKKGELVIEIIKKSGEKVYLSGRGGLEYMDPVRFRDEGIEVILCEFEYKEYPQIWNKQQGFIPNLSIVDLLFNNLDFAYSYIMNNGRTVRVTI